MIEMISPIATVYRAYILHRHVVGIGDIHQSWAQSLQICTFRVHLPAQPEFLPELSAVTVYCALACDGEAIAAVSIHQCGKVIYHLPLQSCTDDTVVGDGIRTFQLGPIHQMQMCLRFEEERPC